MVFSSVYEMRICKICSSDTTLIQKDRGECWFKYEDGFMQTMSCKNTQGDEE